MREARAPCREDLCGEDSGFLALLEEALECSPAAGRGLLGYRMLSPQPATAPGSQNGAPNSVTGRNPRLRTFSAALRISA